MIFILDHASYGIAEKKTRADYSNISSMINVREYLNYQNNFNKVAFVALK